jgi:hypothetical protein
VDTYPVLPALLAARGTPNRRQVDGSGMGLVSFTTWTEPAPLPLLPIALLVASEPAPRFWCKRLNRVTIPRRKEAQ